MVAGVWTVGFEREVTPGNYAMLAAEIDGWRLWQFETINGRYFTAGKSPLGRRQVEPLGVAQALYGGLPFIAVHLSSLFRSSHYAASFRGQHLNETSVKFRPVGDRFMQDVKPGFDPMPFDGQQIEIVMRTMPGPKSFAKIVEDHGVIDMTGLSAIIEAKREIAG